MISIRYFAHATTRDNEDEIATGSAEVELSALGREQVLDLRNAVQGEDFTAVFSSDLSRALETAKGALGDRYEVRVDTRLREINIGDMTRKPDTEVNEMLPRCVLKRFPNGESLTDVEERVRAFLTEIALEFEGKKVAIVAHRMPQLALEVITKGMSWDEALSNDWRNTKSFQYGWDYTFKP